MATINQLIREFDRVLSFRAGDVAYCRFTREALTVVDFDGGACVTVRDTSDSVSHRIVGELTRVAPADGAAS